MPTPLSTEEIERLAQKRANAKMGWYIHAMVYVLVNGFLILGPALEFRTRPWNAIPALGWGIGLACHFIAVFLLGGGSSFRENMVRRERERIEREQNRP